MSPWKAIVVCSKGYASFSGRATRAEYWWFALFVLILSVVASLVDELMLANTAYSEAGIAGLIVSLVTLLPSLAVSARRLHDINRSGWWQLIVFLPILGLLILIFWALKKGDAGANRFGPAVRN